MQGYTGKRAIGKAQHCQPELVVSAQFQRGCFWIGVSAVVQAETRKRQTVRRTISISVPILGVFILKPSDFITVSPRSLESTGPC